MKKIFYKISNWFRVKDRFVYLEFFILALLIMGPLLKAGYIFAPDMIFFPHHNLPNFIDNLYLYHLFVYLIDFIIPNWLIQKVFIFLVFFLSGVGAYKLVPTKNKWPRYFAAFFYIFNPFVYGRMLYGQILLLLAYALMPWFLRQLIIFIKKPTLRESGKLLIWMAAIGFLNLHHIFFIWFIFAVFILGYIIFRYKSREHIFQILKFSLVIVIGFALVNSFWLWPYFSGGGEQVKFIEQIDSRQFLVFRTAADATYHPLFDTAAMYGFWGERQHRFMNQKEMVTNWFWIYLGLLAVILWGVARAFIKDKERKKLWLYFSLIFVGAASWILAVGIEFPPFKSLMNFLYNHLPLFKGFRDSHKFISLTILFYIYFGALGADDIINRVSHYLGGRLVRIRKLAVSAVIFILLLLPLAYGQGILWGFRGQLFTSWYPESWFEVNDLLKEDADLAARKLGGFTGGAKVLFFPWHQYLALSFADYKVIANPAPEFFDRQVIAGDNMQIQIIQSTSRRPISKFIEQEILPRKNQINNLGERLAPWNVKYVIWALESDFFNYDFLKRQTDLELIYYKDKIAVYKNKMWKE